MTRILLGAALPALLAFGPIHSATAQTVPRIVFVAPGTKGVQIFSMNPDGSGVVELTSANADAYAPRWSPGQQYIAFGRNQTLYVMEAKGEANGGRTFAVAPAWMPGGSDWSPDGTRLVYESTNSNLYIVPVDVVNGKAGTSVLFRSRSYSDPSWSPDGKRIAFWGSDDGNLPFFIKVRDVASGAEISFGVSDPAANGISNMTPQWSPDGSLIAFAGPVEGTNGTACEIFIANADGSEIRRVTYLNSYTLFPTWSPDGTTIAFRSDVSGTLSVYKMVLGSNVATLLYSLANNPDWNSSVMPLPTLNLALDGNQLVLSWPTNAAGFTLQSSPELGPSATWSDSTDSPVTVAEQYFVTNSISATAQFYRLKK